jgi:serine/threonine protein phosphatase 1
MPVTAGGQRPKVFRSYLPAAIYAVGDIHGCHALLKAMEKQIIVDGAEIAGEKIIVYLGDYVDRGPNSAGVLDHLMPPAPTGFERICLAGNHEDVMLSFLEQPSWSHKWIAFGGADTLASYGLYQSRVSKLSRSILNGFIPGDHIAFLSSLPSLFAIPGYCFVHGGIRPGRSLENQTDRDLLWLRPGDNDGDINDYTGTLVHGHTPVEIPDVSLERINVDTGAYVSGRLTCVRVSPNSEPKILTVAL